MGWQSSINAVPEWMLSMILFLASIAIFTLRRSSPLLLAVIITGFLVLRVFNPESTLNRRIWGPAACVPILLWLVVSPLRSLIFDGTF